MDDLYNDKDLNDELSKLGWNANQDLEFQFDDSNPGIDFDSIDISSIGIIDESKLGLDEHDMRDPELLGLYNQLQSGGSHNEIDLSSFDDSPSKSPIKVKEEPLILDSKAMNVSKAERINVNEVTQFSTNMTAEEAKLKALKFKKEGNIEEARKWLRFSKTIETSILNKSKSKSLLSINAPNKPPKPTSSKPVPTGQQPVQNGPQNNLISESQTVIQNPPPVLLSAVEKLEATLRELTEENLTAAKKLKESDPKKAVEKMREYKRYKQELEVLQVRMEHHPQAKLPLFHWESQNRQEVIENLEIGETELRLIVTGAYDIDNLLSNKGSKTLSIQINFGSLIKDDNTTYSTQKVSYENGKVEFNYTKIINGIKRTKASLISFGNKKINFEIILHPGLMGFFRSNETLAVAQVSLEDLLKTSEISTTLPLFDGEISKTGSIKKAKAVGGSLKVKITLRSPLSGPEVRVTSERKLIIDKWPDVNEPQSPSPILEKPQSEKSSKDYLKVNQAEVNPPTPLPSQSNPNVSKYAAELTDLELKDPESAEFLISNDVLEAEIKILEEEITKRARDEEFTIPANAKLQLLYTKLQLLVYNVQNDKLTMEQYLELLTTRVKRDKNIALYFKNLQTPESIKIALKIMSRIKIMEKEIASANEAT